MGTVSIRKADFRDESEMIAILFCVAMFKLGGELTLTLGEIQKIFADFPEVRLILKRTDATGMQLRPEHELMTLQLRSREAVEEDNLKGEL